MIFLTTYRHPLLAMALLSQLRKGCPFRGFWPVATLPKLGTAAVITSLYPHAHGRLPERGLGSLAALRQSAATLNFWADVPTPHIYVVVNNTGVVTTDFKLFA